MTENPFDGLTKEDRDFILRTSSEFFVEDEPGHSALPFTEEIEISGNVKAREININLRREAGSGRAFRIDSNGVYSYLSVSAESTDFYILRNGRIEFTRESLHSEVFETIPSLLAPSPEISDRFSLMDKTRVGVFGWVEEESEGVNYDLSHPDSSEKYFLRMNDPGSIKRIRYRVDAGEDLTYELDIFNKGGLMANVPMVLALSSGRIWEREIVDWGLKNHRLNLLEERRAGIVEDLTQALNLIQYKVLQGSL